MQKKQEIDVDFVQGHSLGESVPSIVGLSLGLMDASFLTFGATLGLQLGYLIPATTRDSSGNIWTYFRQTVMGYLMPATA